MRRLFLILAFAVAASAQVRDSAQTYPVTGKVVNSANGQPIPHALVQSFGFPGHLVFTDDSGVFAFDAIPGGQVVLQARKPGFFAPEEIQAEPAKPVIVGPDAPPIVLRLVPEAVVFGQVADTHGEPLEQTSLHLLSDTVQNGRRTISPAYFGQTDDRGEYRIFGIRPGHYYLEVSGGHDLPLSVQSSGARVMAFPASFYYPGVTDASSAALLQLRAGQQANIDFTLPVAPAYSVSGRVLGLPPNAAGATLSFGLPYPDNLSFNIRFDSRDGAFEVPRVPAGRYLASAQAQDAAGKSYYAETTVEVVKDIGGLNLALTPDASIPILERDEFTQPPQPEPSVRVLLGPTGHTEINHFQLQLVSSDRRNYSAATWYGPADNRSFGLERVRPGTYTAEFSANGPWYVSSATCGNVDLFREPLTIVSGIAPQPIEVTVRDDVAFLEGTVAVPTAGSAAHLLIISPTQPLQPPREMMLAAGQRNPLFRLPLPPGDYIVLAFDTLADLEYRNPSALAPYLSRGAEVTISPGATSRVTLNLIRRSE